MHARNRIYWNDGDAAQLGTKRAAAAPAGVAHVPASERVVGDGKEYTFTISTARVDRSGDSIAVEGWNIADYARNPVVLASHDSGDLGSVIGKSVRVFRDSATLKATMKFANTRHARMVQGLVEDKVLKSASVGFAPGEWKWAKRSADGIDFISGHSLLEWSICAIPCNPDCLIASKYAGKTLRELVDMRPDDPAELQKWKRHVDVARIKLRGEALG
jgi:HK97 family phage prohead protease